MCSLHSILKQNVNCNFFFFFFQFEEYGLWSHVSFLYRLKISQWHRQTHRKTKIQLDIATNKLSQQKGWLNKEEKVIWLQYINLFTGQINTLVYFPIRWDRERSSKFSRHYENFYNPFHLDKRLNFWKKKKNVLTVMKTSNCLYLCGPF